MSQHPDTERTLHVVCHDLECDFEHLVGREPTAEEYVDYHERETGHDVEYGRVA